MSGIYANIDSVGRKITQVPVIIDGVERYTKTGYACVDGVGREFFGGGSVSGTPLNDYVVGTPVYLNVNGVRTSFILANKGLPTGTNGYDSSCNGMWLVMNNIYEKRQWHSNNNKYTSYANTTIHSYLNSTFLNLLDSKIKNVIKTVKIPYTKFVTIDPATGEELLSPMAQSQSGSNGLSTRIFLLSGSEVGLGNVYEGARLSYFNSTTRIGYYNGTATIWYLRTPYTGSGSYGASVVQNDGNSSGGASWAASSITSFGIRPAFILPSDIQVDSNFNIIA